MRRTAYARYGITALLGLSVEQQRCVEAAAQFARQTFDPVAAHADAAKELPVEALRQAATMGFAGMYASPTYGGSGLTRLETSAIVEQLAGADASTTAFLTIHNMCTWMIDTFGGDELKKALVPQLCTMQNFASYCLTEPGSGSDAAALRTTATLSGGDYILSGSKAFISGGGFSDWYVIMARKGNSGPSGISCFAVSKTSKGLSFGRNETKLGWNSQPTCMVNLDQVRVPQSHRLGDEGQGFKIAMAGLDGGRVNIASCSLGAAQRCLDIAVEYAQQRKQFGESLMSFQNTQFTAAAMAADIHASRLLIRSAATAIDQHREDATVQCAMAKMFATEKCFNVADSALQILGGYGYLRDHPIERHLRDLRVHRILEGTNEVMKIIISRPMTKKS